MIVLKRIKPLFNGIITTMDLYEEDQRIGSMIDTTRTKGTMKEYQTVIAVGDGVRSIKVGNVVSINPKRYAIQKHKENSLKDGIISDNMTIGYRFDTISINGKECLKLYDSDINFIVEEMEEVADNTGPVLIQPDKPKLVV